MQPDTLANGGRAGRIVCRLDYGGLDAAGQGYMAEDEKVWVEAKLEKNRAEWEGDKQSRVEEPWTSECVDEGELNLNAKDGKQSKSQFQAVIRPVKHTDTALRSLLP